MSREILFRGKNVDNDVWVEGYLMDENCINVPFEDNNVGDYLFYYINPITRGQYTGLRDRNGTKIFEGDIIKSYYTNTQKSEFIETVVFSKGQFVAEYRTNNGVHHSKIADGIKHLPRDKSVYMTECEIIGNIYDNPELLGDYE